MNTGIADFLFTGVVVLPVALALGGRFDVAMMVFSPLLIAACLASMYADASASPSDERTRRKEKSD